MDTRQLENLFHRLMRSVISLILTGCSTTVVYEFLLDLMAYQPISDYFMHQG